MDELKCTECGKVVTSNFENIEKQRKTLFCDDCLNKHISFCLR